MDFDFTLNYAVIGASNNVDKYGYKIFKFLKDKKFNVIPVNPNESLILGVSVVKSVEYLDSKTVLIFLVPPEITLPIVKTAILKGFKKFWFQPGSYTDEILTYCFDQGVEFSAGVCLLQL